MELVVKRLEREGSTNIEVYYIDDHFFGDDSGILVGVTRDCF